METIQQELIIPENHQLNLNIKIPDSIPPGLTKITLLFEPISSKFQSAEIMKYFGLFKNEWKGVDPVQVQKEMRNEWD